MVFQFVQIGNDEGAEEYLSYLGTKSEVAEYVHVIPGTTVTEILDKLNLRNEGPKARSSNTTCNKCSTSFPSRNALFLHLHSSQHFIDNPST